MKQLTCEMCGGTDLVKTDGMFVCQSCGCKYTSEEARKMMGADEAPVRNDKAEKLASLYQIARRARDENNAENAAKYYDLILQEDPMSWEASFYTVYFQSMQTNIAGIESAAYRLRNCLGSVLKLIRSQVPDGQQAAAVEEVVSSSCALCRMLADAARNHYKGLDISIQNKYVGEYIQRASAAADTLCDLGALVESTFPEPNVQQLAASAWKKAVSLLESVVKLRAMSTQESARKRIAEYIEKISRYDPSYGNARRATQLRADIAALDRQLGNQDLSARRKVYGVFLLILGVVMFLIRQSRQDIYILTFWLAFLPLVGLVALIGGIRGLRRKDYPGGIIWTVLGAFQLPYGLDLMLSSTTSTLIYGEPREGFFPDIPYAEYLAVVMVLVRGVLYLVAKPSKAQAAANAKKIQELQEKRDALQKELDSLNL